jgi:hypothetical protein
MRKPTPLQVRNILAATLAAALSIWNLAVGGTWWLSVIFALACALAIASAIVNRTKSTG